MKDNIDFIENFMKENKENIIKEGSLIFKKDKVGPKEFESNYKDFKNFCIVIFVEAMDYYVPTTHYIVDILSSYLGDLDKKEDIYNDLTNEDKVNIYLHDKFLNDPYEAIKTFPNYEELLKYKNMFQTINKIYQHYPNKKILINEDILVEPISKWNEDKEIFEIGNVPFEEINTIENCECDIIYQK